MTAVNFTGGGDLKQLMGEKKIMTEDEQNMGISIDITYLKQAEHLLRTNAYQSAIKYTLKALELNAESTVKQFVSLSFLAQMIIYFPFLMVCILLSFPIRML